MVSESRRELASIFELFAQGTPANRESREEWGSGWPGAELVELHAGTLTARAMGSGAEPVHRRLPLGPRMKSSASPPRCRRRVGGILADSDRG
jgi:hypothetical protein